MISLCDKLRIHCLPRYHRMIQKFFDKTLYYALRVLCVYLFFFFQSINTIKKIKIKDEEGEEVKWEP